MSDGCGGGRRRFPAEAKRSLSSRFEHFDFPEMPAYWARLLEKENKNAVERLKAFTFMIFNGVDPNTAFTVVHMTFTSTGPQYTHQLRHLQELLKNASTYLTKNVCFYDWYAGHVVRNGNKGMTGSYRLRKMLNTSYSLEEVLETQERNFNDRQALIQEIAERQAELDSMAAYRTWKRNERWRLFGDPRYVPPPPTEAEEEVSDQELLDMVQAWQE